MSFPIAIFAFNRPASLQRLINSLNQCADFRHAIVTVFIDGPRNPAEAVLVSETIAVAQAAAGANWLITISPVNKGLRRSIYDGVTQVCHLHGRAIVLEDDLVVAPAALQYFSQALDRYADNDRVWSICGYAPSNRALSRENRAFFLPYAHPWGWATWQRSWEKFEYEQPTLKIDLLKSRSFRNFFNVGGLNLMGNMLHLAQDGLLDSWFVRWHLQIFREGGMSLFPTRKYTANLGTRSGTHASALNISKFLLGKSEANNEELPAWPDEILPDFLLLDQMISSREARLHRIVARLGEARRRLKSNIKKVSR